LKEVAMDKSTPFFTGQLLLALPGIGDPRFEKAVVAICAHDENGAMGIGVGRVLPRLRLHEILRQFDIDPGAAPDVAVHQGGPVEPERGFVLHSLDWGGEDTRQVANLWAFTSTLDVLKAIARGSGPRQWLVAMGYAGWSAGQLDEELTRHGWHLVPSSAELIYDTPVNERWASAFQSCGINAALLSGISGSA
jgi:putative transcriptional regulator